MNLPQQSAIPEQPVPSVINLVNQADKPSSGEAVYTSVSDPVRKGADAAESPRDWTIKRPAPEKVEYPPPEPMSKVLLDHIKSLWQASASAVQVQQLVKDQVDLSKPAVNVAQGVVATEVFTYSPTKINKVERTQT